MKSFMEHLEHCHMEFDTKSPMEYLNRLAQKILEDESFNKYGTSVNQNNNFYEAYQTLRAAYQK